jgi:hypothetical protein
LDFFRIVAREKMGRGLRSFLSFYGLFLRGVGKVEDRGGEVVVKRVVNVVKKSHLRGA